MKNIEFFQNKSFTAGSVCPNKTFLMPQIGIQSMNKSKFTSIKPLDHQNSQRQIIMTPSRFNEQDDANIGYLGDEEQIS